MATHDVDLLVTKDAGGEAAAKLVAARALGVPVVVVRRPVTPEVPVVATVDEALRWLGGTTG
jgi:precorrin-6A/cobalt-precorrin-6A reductase